MKIYHLLRFFSFAAFGIAFACFWLLFYTLSNNHFCCACLYTAHIDVGWCVWLNSCHSNAAVGKYLINPLCLNACNHVFALYERTKVEITPEFVALYCFRWIFTTKATHWSNILMCVCFRLIFVTQVNLCFWHLRSVPRFFTRIIDFLSSFLKERVLWRRGMKWYERMYHK